MLILVGVLVIILAATRPASLGLSDFEVRRQEKAGILTDFDVRRAVNYRAVMTLLNLKILVMLAVFIILAVWLFGWTVGTITALIFVILFPVLAKIKPIKLLAEKLYIHYEKYMLSFVDKAGWLVRFFELPEDKQAREAKPKLFSKSELRSIIRTSPGILSETDTLLINGALKFNDKTVGDIMTPLESIEAVDAKELLGPVVLSDLHKTGHRRFPVTNGDLNHVVGVLYIDELLVADSSQKSRKVSEAMNKNIGFVHQTYSLKQALEASLATDNSLLIVVNSARETVGLITLEDILGSLFGKNISIDAKFDKHSDLEAVAKRKQNN